MGLKNYVTNCDEKVNDPKKQKSGNFRTCLFHKKLCPRKWPLNWDLYRMESNSCNDTNSGNWETKAKQLLKQETRNMYQNIDKCLFYVHNQSKITILMNEKETDEKRNKDKEICINWLINIE